MTRTRFANPEHVTLLTSPSWSACEGLIKAFESDWRRGLPPAIGDFLRADGPQRRALLVELVHIDLEFRLKAGEPARVETYLRDYPELAEDREVTIELLAAEYELRRPRDSAVGLEEYRLRFPDLQDDLFDYLRAHLAATVDSRRKARAGLAARPSVPGYELLEEIGRGGMGVVYKAREPRLDRHVALKFLPAEYSRDPDRLARFLREARTASGLNHPHICTVHALGEHEGRPFLVMEFIEGQTLKELAAGRPGVEEVARLLGQAARALEAAHAAGVVHRDIKPENVMARGDGYVKVLDFGLARRLPTLAGAVAAEQDTDPGTFMGTAAYMSPEQTRGDAADSASDVFSLGIVLYELTTGRHPFDGDSAVEMMHAIATRQPRVPSRVNPEIPAALDGLTEAMLRKDPRLRPTAAEVVATLAAVEGGSPRRPAPAPERPIVHREPELTGLRAAFASAEAGRGAFVCFGGEPGIGKTTVVEAFLDELAAPGASPCFVARGHCSERLGGTEAYLSVIDALADLLRGDGGPSAARLMKVTAPTWYSQVAPAAGPAGPARAFTRQAMLLEVSAFLEEASRLSPVVLFFDDVHWADVSTVDLLAHLGPRCRGLRVLIVVTYRPTELLLGPHPFHAVKLELLGKGACAEWTLGFLGRQDVERYLSLAFPGHDFPADLADVLHARTEGNPLFLVDLLRYLIDRGVIAESGGRWSLTREVPDWRRDLPLSVRSMIQRKIERLGEEDRRLLAAASVQGNEFDAAVVAAALRLDPADVEDRLQVLDRVHRLVRLVREYELPDRTLTRRYAFVHALYQEALYNDLPPGRRSSLSAAVAQALETHHREAGTVAAELACLYEVARDFRRAGRRFGQAALNAGRVSAHREAVDLARRGLRLLDALPETRERDKLEFPLQVTLGLQLQVTQGYAAPGAKDAYTRARGLRRDGAEAASLFPVLWGLWLYHKVRSELPRAWEMAGELQELARRENEPDLSLQAYQALGITALCRGDLATSLRHVEQATAMYDSRRHRTHSSIFGQDPGVICTAFGAVTLWLLGYPAQAASQSERAVQMGREQSPSSQAVAYHFAAMLYQLLRDVPRARRYAEASAKVSAEHGFSFWLAGSAVLGGWARAGEEGLAQLRRGLDDWAATGSVTYRTWYLGLLAEALGTRGQAEEARRVLDEALALADQTDERLYEAELHRLRGEMLLLGGEPGAEDAFLRALDVARRQEAKSLGLRAAMSLARRCGRRDLLAEAFATFAEGFDTPDLVEARELLTEGERKASGGRKPPV